MPEFDAKNDSELRETLPEAQTTTLAEQLESLTAENDVVSGVSLAEPKLDFIDGAASDVDDSVAMELILKSLRGTEATGMDHDIADGAGVETETDADAETSDEPVEFIDNDRLISIVESLLFATDKPVSIATIKMLFKGSNIRTRDIQRALDGLASSYASADRGVSLEEIHGGYQLRTKVDNTEYLKRLAKVRPFRLSGPALEVLAIAAYKQPITKTEVDQIRGVESGHLMRALMERGMVGFGEKSDLPGRPMTYVTTRKFLETFGLRNIKELPTLAEIDQLLPEGIGDEDEKETLSDVTDAMSNHIGTTYSEGEDELQDISESLKVIDTTSEFFEQEKIRQRVERDRERAQDIRDRLTFGEAVEDKDRRWLARFEAKEEQIAQAAQTGAVAGPLVVEDEGAAEGGGLSDQLAALSSENQNPAGFDSEESGDENVDELSARPDFDDTDSDSENDSENDV